MVDLTHLRIDPHKLKEARQRARGGQGYTQAEAGAAVGVQKAAISKIEGGSGLPSSEVLARLCALYEIDLAEITTDGDLVPAGLSN